MHISDKCLIKKKENFVEGIQSSVSNILQKRQKVQVQQLIFVS